MQMTVTKALNAYFNTNPEHKIAPSAFLAELKALTPFEKHELAYLASQAEGWTLVDSKGAALGAPVATDEKV
jgi:hypothetical protein